MVHRYSMLVTALFTLALYPLSGAVADAPRTLTTSFTYTATVPQPATGAAVDLWIPIPSDGALQTIHDLKVDATGPYKINRERKFGNRMIYLHVDRPAGPTVVTVRFTVDRKEAKVLGSDDGKGPAVAGPHVSLASFTGPDRLVPVGGRYLEMAKVATGGRGSTLDRMRAIYDQTVANMQYDYKKESPEYAQGDVAFVCDYKKGNCSDLHSYVISLARSLDIPAFIEYGFPLTGVPVPNQVPAEGSIAGYHCWTWFHDPDHGWVPLDASDGRRWLDAGKPPVKDSLFGNLVLERSAVAFSRGRDITLVPAQKAPPLNNFIYPYAESNGKPVESKWEVRYKLASP